MRHLFEGRAGMALAFVLGLVIATGATAGATSLITGGQIKNGTIGAKDLSKAVRKKLARAGVPGPRGVQGAKGDQGPAAGQVVAAVGANFVSTTAGANTTLAAASFTLSAPAHLLVVFGGSWVYGPAGRVEARLALTSQGQQVGAGGRDVNHQSPSTTEGQADWTGFIHPSTPGTFAASLVPAGTYSLTATSEELNIPVNTAGQWSGVSMTVIAVRPAP